MNPCMSECRDPENRNKKKLCICGGHNHKNVKKNKHHHATKVKLLRNIARRFKQQIRGEAEKRLRECMAAGFLPMAMLYRDERGGILSNGRDFRELGRVLRFVGKNILEAPHDTER